MASIAEPAAAAFPGTNGPIAFERVGANGPGIAAVNADGTNSRPELTAAPPADRDASWSSDGRRLAFTSLRDGNEEIYVLDVGNGAQTRITFSAARDHDPSWSPDGSRIAFASDRDGNSEIYTMPSAGGVPRRLTFDPADDRQPAWSPGRAIAFASNRGGDTDIYVVDEQGGVPQQVTRELDQDVDPSWAPGGSRLAYSHRSNGTFFVDAIDIDGRNQQQLAVGHFPAWSPDGTRIAYATQSGSIIVTSAVPAGGSSFVAAGTDPNWGPLPPPAGPPDAGRDVTASPVSGRVLIAPATSAAPTQDPLEQTQLRTANELPTGSTIDATGGTLAIDAITTTPDGPNTIGHAIVTGGVFRLTQIGFGEPTLRFLRPAPACGVARASRLPPEVRLRIRARGRFRTVTRYGRGSGRGTEWTMRDRCDGTSFRVFEGTVLVHDFRRRRSFRVRAGRCYLAARVRRADALRPKRRCPRVRPPR
jgi:dipeptidyl aminopeptidase/acylaminoacyl peptidase